VNSTDQARLLSVCLEVIGLEEGELDDETDFTDDLNLDRESLPSVGRRPRVVAAYAAAERRGEVTRASNVRHT
jgi:hypothetical protein